MQRMGDKPCFIGEGPVWCKQDAHVYFVNPQEREIGRLCLGDGTVEWLPVAQAASSIAFTADGRMLVATQNGVFYRESDGALSPVSEQASAIRYANDGKIGPDGAFYVGTQSSKRIGASDAVDGKLYRIAPNGSVSVLLDGLILSNGLDWSPDGARFYHTDSDTKLLREYTFSKGAITFTGREVEIDGIDGLTVDADGRIYVACWGFHRIAVMDPVTFTEITQIDTPCTIPTSCCFAGDALQSLVVVSADYDGVADGVQGYVYRHPMAARGKLPYIFG